MIANAAVMMLLLQQERRNGWDPHDWDGAFDVLMILFFTIIFALGILWVLS